MSSSLEWERQATANPLLSPVFTPPAYIPSSGPWTVGGSDMPQPTQKLLPSASRQWGRGGGGHGR